MTVLFLGSFSSPDWIKAGKTETYEIGTGTDYSNEVTHLKGDKPGAVIYVTAGIHGDETAAWLAGNRLKEITLSRGELFILSPANRWGAAKNSRYLTEEQDLNRAFPGDAEGRAAQRAAKVIWEDIARVKPDLVLDLHEARSVREGYDFLGNSLIFTELWDCDSLFMDLLAETEAGNVGNGGFSTFGPAPGGSLNRTVSLELGIPVITIETLKEETGEQRIANHLAIVRYCMEWFGISEE